MLQNPCKTLDFKKSMVYKIPPGGGEVNHIQPVAYTSRTSSDLETNICKVSKRLGKILGVASQDIHCLYALAEDKQSILNF